MFAYILFYVIHSKTSKLPCLCGNAPLISISAQFIINWSVYLSEFFILNISFLFLFPFSFWSNCFSPLLEGAGLFIINQSSCWKCTKMFVINKSSNESTLFSRKILSINLIYCVRDDMASQLKKIRIECEKIIWCIVNSVGASKKTVKSGSMLI